MKTNQTFRVSFWDSKGEHTVTLEFSTIRNSVNIEVDYEKGTITCIEESFFAGIIMAICSSGLQGVHAPGMPEYCQCTACCDGRAERLAKKIEEYRESKNVQRDRD